MSRSAIEVGYKLSSPCFEFQNILLFQGKFEINNEANLSTKIEQYENQLKSTLETLDSRIIKYFDRNGTVNEENMSGTDVPCSILESLLAADFEQINRPLVAQFLMVCSSKCDEDDEFLNDLRDFDFLPVIQKISKFLKIFLGKLYFSYRLR